MPSLSSIFGSLPTLRFVVNHTIVFVLPSRVQRAPPQVTVAVDLPSSFTDQILPRIARRVLCWTVGSACVFHDSDCAMCHLIGASRDPLQSEAPDPPVSATRHASSTLTCLLPSPDAATCPSPADVAFSGGTLL
ncbi:hypothetical protein PIB30_072620 [Stylosanthes scabra]|uniref:Uncharacterized protein n=1 Tax=Stylosanthes scabra TaxID=79078 RepID=A0ABU6YMB9_9FABA|nr:hypothetical protein [Stylosanthes scabra]